MALINSRNLPALFFCRREQHHHLHYDGSVWGISTTNNEQLIIIIVRQTESTTAIRTRVCWNTCKLLSDKPQNRSIMDWHLQEATKKVTIASWNARGESVCQQFTTRFWWIQYVNNRAQDKPQKPQKRHLTCPVCTCQVYHTRYSICQNRHQIISMISGFKRETPCWSVENYFDSKFWRLPKACRVDCTKLPKEQ